MNNKTRNYQDQFLINAFGIDKKQIMRIKDVCRKKTGNCILPAGKWLIINVTAIAYAVFKLVEWTSYSPDNSNFAKALEELEKSCDDEGRTILVANTIRPSYHTTTKTTKAALIRAVKKMLNEGGLPK